MAENELQPPTPQAPKRDEKGRLLPGNTANPGGFPKRIAKARKLLSKGSIPAAQFLIDVVEGKDVESFVTEDGERMAVPARAKERIAAAKVILEHTVPKPKADGDDSSPAAQETREIGNAILRRLAGLDS